MSVNMDAVTAPQDHSPTDSDFESVYEEALEDEE
jgi:hypothetical protein